jgi:hypothetical protein
MDQGETDLGFHNEGSLTNEWSRRTDRSCDHVTMAPAHS